MKPYSSARTEGKQDASVFLDANENPYPPYPATAECVGLNRYPEPQPTILIDRFSELYGVSRDSLFVSRGADEGIDLLVRAFCEAKKDAILITPPTFVMYETAAEVQGAAVYRVPLLRGKRFELDVERMLATHAVHPTIKLVFVCSPNNPTGNLMRRVDVLRLADSLFGKALIVIDQLYVDYSGEPSYVQEIQKHPNIVVVRSVSKEYSLAGERCGITIAHPEVIAILRRIMAPYSMTITSIRSIAKGISPEGIEYGQANIKKLLSERTRIEAALSASSAITNIFPSDSNFLLVQTKNAALLTAMMEERGIKIRNRSAMVESSVRISVGTPAENDQLLKVFAEYTKKV